MGRNGLVFLLIMVFAGAAGGVAVHLLAPSSDTAGVSFEAGRAPSDRGDSRDGFQPTDEEWGRLRLRVDGLLGDVAGLEDQLTRAHGRIEDLEKAAREAAVARSREPEEAVASFAAKHPLRLFTGAMSTGPGRMVRIGNMGKAAELLTLPEEERWRRIREELSLDSYQEAELKRIGEEVKAGVRDAFLSRREEEKPGIRGSIAKMMEAQKEADERVRRLLSDDQYDRFKKGGYGPAVGIGSSSFAVSYTSSRLDPRDPEPK